MKTMALICLGMAFLLVSVLLVNSSQAEKGTGERLRHVVLFKFKADTTPAQVDNLVKEFQKLPSKISEIKEFEWGTDSSPEGKNKGFTHCFLVTFADEAGRDAYLPHPAHKEFVAILRPLLEDVTVIDYWAKK